MSSSTLIGIAFLAFLGFLFSPIALFVAIRAGRFDIGLATVTTSPTRSDRGAVGELEPDEDFVVITHPKRSRWTVLCLLGIVTVPFGWGVAMIVYALRVRNRPQYVFTDRRLLIENRGETDAVPLDAVSQIQAGVSPLESILNRGHVTFRVGETQLETISYLTGVDELVDAITEAQATAVSPASSTLRSAEQSPA